MLLLLRDELRGAVPAGLRGQFVGASLLGLLLRARRTTVCGCDRTAPRNEISRAVVTVDDAFDQRRTLCVGQRDLDRIRELAAVAGAQSAAVAVCGVEGRNQ